MRFKWYEWVAEGVSWRWYHGRAYRDFATLRTRTWVVPLNFAVRGWMQLRYWWDLARSRPSWLDKRQEEIARAEAEKYQQAMDEVRAVRQRLRRAIDQIARVWGDPMTGQLVFEIRLTEVALALERERATEMAIQRLRKQILRYEHGNGQMRPWREEEPAV